ncbi:hypothetical protein Rin_00014280 [Candidatus Regiella insecticola 5.15]|uniref:Uncharacterized protein n=2 Tax=Candidatus Regiella insecticola TaxID=138073 RepID=G2H048_9ENTR|nr:hypothetical protein [Candidatus Regiella insecticola]EGY28643.1 hypothetical protein Rin_00014280 [Candidatus Regiella insecticola 5.15]
MNKAFSMTPLTHWAEVLPVDAWVLHLTHEYHDEDLEGYVVVSEKITFHFLYRTIAYLQLLHHQVRFKRLTEDLCGKQMAFLLGKLLGYAVIEGHEYDGEDTHPEFLNLFWNWEQGCVRLGSDYDLRMSGKPAFFHPDIQIEDYFLPNAKRALMEMDWVFSQQFETLDKVKYYASLLEQTPITSCPDTLPVSPLSL